MNLQIRSNADLQEILIKTALAASRATIGEIKTAIDAVLEKMDDEDVAGHIYWMGFREFVEQFENVENVPA